MQYIKCSNTNRYKKIHGRFDKAFLTQLWRANNYTGDEIAKLSSLLLHEGFDVCFETEEKDKKIFIVPQHLPAKKPDTYVWKPVPSTLRYVYQYRFMPKGIIGRLIIALNKYIELKEDMRTVWKQGAVLVFDEMECSGKALIIQGEHEGDGRKLIRIEVQSDYVDDRKEILRRIREALNAIHRNSFRGLTVSQQVPCNCVKCKNISFSIWA